MESASTGSLRTWDREPAYKYHYTVSSPPI